MSAFKVGDRVRCSVSTGWSTRWEFNGTVSGSFYPSSNLTYVHVDDESLDPAMPSLGNETFCHYSEMELIV